LEQRQRLDPARIPWLRETIADAHALAASCRIGDALKTFKTSSISSSVMEPEATDVEVLISKLSRRLTLFEQSASDVISEEFCTIEPAARRKDARRVVGGRVWREWWLFDPRRTGAQSEGKRGR
jgi:hypothetical protein